MQNFPFRIFLKFPWKKFDHDQEKAALYIKCCDTFYRHNLSVELL
jgi:hypothetical protein